MSRASTIRDDLINDIELLLDDEEFTLNNLQAEATQLPIDDLKALHTPKLWLVTQGGDEITRNRALEWNGERGIQLILKQTVNLSSVDDCDRLETLLDELKEVCRAHYGIGQFVFNGATKRFNYRALRIEPLRDAAGTPYAFGLIHDTSVFEGIFTVIYEIVSE